MANIRFVLLRDIFIIAIAANLCYACTKDNLYLTKAKFHKETCVDIYTLNIKEMIFYEYIIQQNTEGDHIVALQKWRKLWLISN